MYQGRSSHSVIGKQQEKREVEGRHLTDFALAAQTYPDQHNQINRPRAQYDLQCDVEARREKHSVQLAVTGTGAPLGVLKYPVAFFLSTFHTTSSNSK